MSLLQWLIMIFAGVFLLVMLVSLTVFVVRIFREAQPQKTKGGDRGGKRFKKRKA